MPVPASDRHARTVSIIDHLMATGALLPSRMSSPSTWSPEARLARAVLGQALIEIRDHSDKPEYRRRIVQDLEWIGSNDRSWPYSFLRLCDSLGLEPEYVRRHVAQWMQTVARPQQRLWSAHRLFARSSNDSTRSPAAHSETVRKSRLRAAVE